MYAILATPNHLGLVPVGEAFTSDTVGRCRLALTHKSRLWYNTTSTDSRVQGIGDGIAFVLADAVVQYAGYSNGSADVSTLQDQTLRNSSLLAAVAQKTYVGNQFTNFIHAFSNLSSLQVRYQGLVAPLTLVDGSSYQTPAEYFVGVYRLLAMYVLIYIWRLARPTPRSFGTF